MKIPETISAAVLSISGNKYVIMLLISLIILVAGVFMETSSAIILLTPVFLPLVRALGVSTLHFGVLFVVGIAIGMITPPVGICCYVTSGVTKVPLNVVFKGIWPMVIAILIATIIVIAIPQLSLFLPGVLYS